MKKLLLLLSVAGFLAGQQAPVPVDQEPHHHVLLKNDFVEVLRVTLPAGESTLFHTHTREIAGVNLVTSTTSEQILGKDEGVAETSTTGEVWAESLAKGPYTHRVHNVGQGPMDLVGVEFLQPPPASSPAPAGTIGAENRCARIYKWMLAPGVTSPMHTHQRPYLIVAVTAMKLKMAAPDGRSLSEEVKPGDFHWIEANVTHALANEGASEAEIVEFELK